jgi:hypothetical protein
MSIFPIDGTEPPALITPNAGQVLDHEQGVGPRPPVLPVPPDRLRPFVLAKALPGFMTENTVSQHMPAAGAFGSELQKEIHVRLGKGFDLPPDPTAGRPRFERVSERPVIALLQQYSGNIQPPPATINLVGFEWVEIAPLIAGRLITGKLPGQDQTPDPGDIESIARYCLYAIVNPPGGQEVKLEGTPQGATISFPCPAKLQLAYAGVDNGQFVFRYLLNPLPAAIRVLVADRRAVALTGLGRLLVLRQLGIERALCLVSYGYGLNTIRYMPTIPADLLNSDRPPLIRDFDEDSLSLTVPIRPSITVCNIQVSHSALE